MKYTIGNEIGRGSFGTVYEGFDHEGNRYAIKAVNAEDRAGSDLLRSQFEFLSSLSHPRIVKAADYDTDSPLGCVMVTEFVDGTDIKTYSKGKEPEDLVLLTAKILDALRYLHNQGKLHGDLKPDSILVFDDTDGPEIKLIDAGFDIGKAGELPTLKGTLPYLAPEMIRAMPVDGRGDLYSLGVVLYDILTDSLPFSGSSHEEILKKHLEFVPPEPSRIRHSVDHSWDVFVGNLLKKEPFLRYQDAVQAGLALGRLFGMPSVFVDSILLPESIAPVGRDREIDRIRQMLLPPRGKGVMICGERGCGVIGILERVESRARVGGYGVHRVSLSSHMPALAQILECLEGGGRGWLGSSRILESDSPKSEVDALAGAIVRLRSDSGDAKRHILIVEHGEVMGSDEMRALGAAARRFGESLGVVVACEADGGVSVESPEAADYEKVELKPLEKEDLDGALRSHFGVSAFAEDLADELYQGTKGNAGLIEMTLRHLWSSKSIRFLAGRGRLELIWDRTVRIPTTLRDAMQAKLDCLSDAGLEALRLVCVAQGSLRKVVLLKLLPAERGKQGVAQLADSGLVEVSGDTGLIKVRWDGLIEVVREQTDPEETRNASLQLAEIMEKMLKTGRDFYKLGLLCRAGGKQKEAFGYLVQAGERFVRFSAGDAIRAYGEALECDPGDGSAEVEERIGDLKLARGDLKGAAIYFKRAASSRLTSVRKLGWVLALQGFKEESIKILNGCRKAAEDREDKVEQAHVDSDLGYIYSMQSRRDLSVELLRQARRVFEGNGMPLEAALAAHRMAFVEMRSGNFKSALQAWTDAKADFERAGDSRRAGICIMNQGLCYWKQMEFDRAQESLKNALNIFEHLKVLAERTSCCQNYALILLDEGDLHGAEKLAEEALNINTLLGREAGIVSSRILLSAISLECGNWVKAEGGLADLLDGHYVIDSFQKALIMRCLAMAKARQGEFAKAMSLIDESYALASSAGDSEGQGQAILRKSEILLRFGKAGAAVKVAANALTALGLSSSPLLANEAQRVMGEALCLSGESESGISRLMAAKEVFGIIKDSLYMGRAMRGLALAYDLNGDHDSFARYFQLSVEIFRKANARYDYALALLTGGREAVMRGSFLKGRRFLLEAARIFEVLRIEDLHKKVVDEMQKMPSGDIEIKAVTSLSKISQTLSSSHDLPTVINLVMDLAIEYLGAERGVLMLEDEATGELATFAERKMDKESLREVIGISRSIVESVRATKEPVVASDASKDPRFRNSKSIRMHNIMSVMCVPLTRGEKLLGIIYLDNRGVPAAFSKLERAFVEAFANQVSLAITNAEVLGRLYDDFVDLKARAAEKYSFENIIGPGKRMQEVFRQVDKAAKSTITVLLTGDSGTGKELIAGLLHELSPRRDKPLVKVNCAAIQKDLLETELFGIAKSVATGIAPRSGFFERANGGTIFLDEVGDMPLATQMQVLRVLAEKEFERVGGSKVIKVDVRVISATNQDLKELIGRGRFRKDLYYRLNGMRIHLSPLIERKEDLPHLINHFIRKYGLQNSKPQMAISKQALRLLRRYSWPGNVRELDKCIEHAVVVADGPEIESQHLPDEILESLKSTDAAGMVATEGSSLPAAVREFETDRITRALAEAHGVKILAASRLGIHESTLRKKMKTLGISDGGRRGTE